jgi:hypothetical protein
MITNLKLNRDSRKADDLVIWPICQSKAREMRGGRQPVKSINVVFLFSYAVSVIIHFTRILFIKASL